MGFLTQTLALALPDLRAEPLQGPLPLTAAKLTEWLNGPPSVTGVRVNADTALQLSAVWACVDLVSRDVARTPAPVYLRENRGRSKAETHALYIALHTSPNTHMTAYTFKQTLQAHKMLRGNAFANIERDGSGKIVALWPLHPDRMSRPMLAKSGTLLYLYQLPSGEQRALTQDEVFHLRGLGADGLWGYSTIQLHRETVGLGLAYQEFGARFFGNAASPSGVLQTPGRLTKEAAERMRVSWENAHRGLENAHRVAILEEGLTWQQVSIAPEDAQWLESTKMNRIEIAAGIYHVPPHKIGEMDRATFSNIESQDLDYEGGTLDAEFANWESQVNLSLLTQGERQQYYCEFNRNALTRATFEKRMEGYQKAWWLTGNEIRARENLNPLDGLDEPLLPVNMVLGAENLPKPGTQPALPPPVRLRTVRSDGQGGYELRESADGE